MGAIGAVSLGDAAAQAQNRLKKKRHAYLAWICLGSHYLYLGRPIRQLLFWLTLGGLLLWWLGDFFRLPAMIEKHNRRLMQKLITACEESLRRPLPHLEGLDPPGRNPAPAVAAAGALTALDHVEPPANHVLASDGAAPLKGRHSTVSAFVAASALGVAAALYVFNPPPLFPHSRASFRAVRQVNVRDLPSTASPIRAVVAKETILSGTVEAAAGGTAKWLKIGLGSHSGGYVAVQNLESL
jgi:TM2 domain-containing membrane protein YozV